MTCRAEVTLSTPRGVVVGRRDARPAAESGYDGGHRWQIGRLELERIRYGTVMMVIAHLSDVHIDDADRSAERTQRVMRYLVGLPTPVDVVLVTGDIADHGAEAEYERVRGLVDLPVPVLLCPGNHDVREPFRKVLIGEPPDGTPVNRVHRVGGVLFAMCDSSVPGEDRGLLADETLDWLDTQLAAAADLPAFVCFHHPPVVLGAPYVDRIRQFGAQRLAAVVA